jgi:superfamily II DNA or RNA helicase
MTVELWPHQLGAIRSALRAIEVGRRHGLWVLPTGTGKTLAFASLAAQREEHTLVIVHRDELAQQARQAFRQTWPHAPVAILPEDGWERAQVLIATVQGLPTRLDQIPPDRYGLVVVDEAHHAPAASWDRVISHFQPRLLLGCTATPTRLDGKDLGEVFGPRPLYEYGLGQAMEDGYLVPIRQHGILTTTSLAALSTRGKDFAVRKLAKAVATEERTRLVVASYLDLAEDRPALVFGVDVAHVEQLCAALEARGVKAAGVTGETPLEQRRQVLRDFRDGRLQALVSCEVLSEGYDEQRVSCIVMARPTASLGLYQQCVGRGLRIDRDGSKADCLVLDVIDRGAGRRVQTATCLFGAQVADCGGRDVRDAVVEERTRWRLEPLAPTPAQEARWVLEEDTFWPERPTLRGYAARAMWERAPATKRQLTALARYGFQTNRPLTKGEASYLFGVCKRLDRKYPTPATEKQERLLRRRERWKVGMTKREAAREIVLMTSTCV